MKKHGWLKIPFIMAAVALGASVIAMTTGCAAFGSKGFRVVEPPVKPIDLPELAANLPEGKAMLFASRHQSLLPETSASIDNAVTLTPGVMKDLMGFGADLGKDTGAMQALQAAINKNRDIETLFVVADSKDITKMRISDNVTQMEPGSRTFELLNRIIVEEPEVIVVTNPAVVVPDEDRVVTNAATDGQGAATEGSGAAPGEPAVIDQPTVPEIPQDIIDAINWRDGRDLDTINATDGEVMFLTRNIQAPPGPNLPGDSEWIIARIEGQGFGRLLIMTMDTDNGRRGPSRIFFDGQIEDNRFPVPLTDPALWKVHAKGGSISIELDGDLVWMKDGNFTVERAAMTDSGRRGFLGQWAEVPSL